MIEPQTKAAFIARVRSAREQWEQPLAGLPPEALEQPGAGGAWTLKDVIAHITWYEREMIDILKARAFVGSPYWELPREARNAAIHAENRDKPSEQVLAEAQAVFAELLAQLEALPEVALYDPAYFPGMPEDWLPWQVIASNTYEHYLEHRRLWQRPT